jgi:sugar phosphate isomerase/epimerase
MVPGFHSIALEEHDLATAGAMLRQIGYAAIAVRLSLSRLDPLADTEVRQVQLAMAANGCRQLQLVVDADGPYLIDPWEAEPTSLLEATPACQRRQEYLAAAVEMVAELGGGLVTFSTGPLPSDLDTQVALDRLAVIVLELGELAERVGVRLGLRPRQGHFIDSIGRFERLLRWTNESPLVQLAADVGTMVAGGEMPIVDLLARVGDRLACVYLADARTVVGGEPLIGQGSVSAARVAAGLREVDFAGAVIVEPAASGISPQQVSEYHRAIFSR